MKQLTLFTLLFTLTALSVSATPLDRARAHFSRRNTAPVQPEEQKKQEENLINTDAEQPPVVDPEEARNLRFQDSKQRVQVIPPRPRFEDSSDQKERPTFDRQKFQDVPIEKGKLYNQMSTSQRRSQRQQDRDKELFEKGYSPSQICSGNTYWTGNYCTPCARGTMANDDKTGCSQYVPDLDSISCKSYQVIKVINGVSQCVCIDGYKMGQYGQCELDLGGVVCDKPNEIKSGNNCVCVSGYRKNQQNECVKDPDYEDPDDGCGQGQIYVNGTCKPLCKKINEIFDGNNGCKCAKGYEYDNNLLCIKKEPEPVCGDFEKELNGQCVCIDGYERLSGVCTEVIENQEDDCTDPFELYKDRNGGCFCGPGYSYNKTSKSCILL